MQDYFIKIKKFFYGKNIYMLKPFYFNNNPYKNYIYEYFYKFKIYKIL